MSAEAHVSSADACVSLDALAAEVEQHEARRKQVVQATCSTLTNMQDSVEDTLAGLETIAHDATESRQLDADLGAAASQPQSPSQSIKAWGVTSMLCDGHGDASTLYTQVLQHSAEQRKAILERAATVSEV